MSLISRGIWGLLLLAVSSFSVSAPTVVQLESARDKGLAYLIRQQNGDGSWGRLEGEKVRLTSAVLDTFSKYNVTGLVYRRGVNWLANADANTPDDLSRQIIALTPLKIDTNKMVDKLIASGLVYDSGVKWGPLDEFRFTYSDTALAIRALNLARPSYGIASTVTFLGLQRNTSTTLAAGNGWGFANPTNDTKPDSKVAPTANVLLMLRQVGGASWGQSGDRAASAWLAAQQKTGGVISDRELQADTETALAVQVLGFAKDVSGANAAVLSAYQNGLGYLIGRQSGNGSIDNNIFKTSLALQALFAFRQVLVDVDGDGVPDSVEAILGTNPTVIDNEYLESGNGNNNSDSVDGYYFAEIIVNDTVVLQLGRTQGGLSINDGALPKGMSLNGSTRQLIGAPKELGNYSLSYKVAVSGDKMVYGTALIRVVSAGSDTDNDGMPASFERAYGLNSLDGNDSSDDLDGDGLNNLQEYLHSSDPKLADTDGDGLSDLEEVIYGSSSLLADSDFDGVSDLYEVKHGLNPVFNDANGDLDHDGLSNYQEYLLGLPADNPDVDGDGIIDGLDDKPFLNLAAFLAVQFLLLQ